MTKPLQRPVFGVIFLLLALGMAWWWGQGSGERPPSESFSPQREQQHSQVFQELTRSARVAAHRATAGAGDNQQDRPPVQDRYTGLPVLDERVQERTELGVRKLSRVRLIRKDDFKYPLIRVVDELVPQPQGVKLIRQTAMVADHVMMKLQPAADEAEFLARLKELGGTVRAKMPASKTWLVAFSNASVDTLPKGVANLSALKPWVQFAEPDYLIHTMAVPDDPGFANLWGMQNLGGPSRVEDADIDAPEAWNLHTGSSDVLVAVIDTGIDLNHPDLAPNLWTNPGEIPGNDLDDDGNGYVDDTQGWNFVAGTSDPTDNNGHGTHCAGTIGAAGNNAQGVAGVCWDVSLVALKILDASGIGAFSDGTEAIAYATQLGVSLTSNSWGGGDYSEAMKQAIDEAGAAEIVLVAAAGNFSTNLEMFPCYPASFTNANVISVSALTPADELADYSNYGPFAVDLAAPGSDVYSTAPGGGYVEKSGTSMAAPHVAGACALLLSYRPHLASGEVKDILLRSVDKVSSLEGTCVTGGRLNLFNALLAADDILASPGTDLAAFGPFGGPFSPSSNTYTLTNNSDGVSFWTASVDQPWISVSAASGSLLPDASYQVQVSINSSAAALMAGDHHARVTFTSTETGRVQTRQVHLRVQPPPLYSFNLNEDPGWSRTGEWDYGPPGGQGSSFHGARDPAAAFTGLQVFGINLSGDYQSVVGQPQYLTAGPFDLTGFRSTTLRFRRWLNTDYQPWVYATVDVSPDGQVWHRVWDNGTVPVIEAAWTEVLHDISTHADDQSKVFVRWGHQVRNSSAYSMSGWNIDDIEILATPDRQLRVSLPESVTEGGTSKQGKVTVIPVPTTDMQVSLSAVPLGKEISLPAHVIIPAGQSEAAFWVAPMDDSLLDGTQQVRVTVQAADFPPHSAVMDAHDNESGQLSVTLPEALTEGTGTEVMVGHISLASPAEAVIKVELKSSDTTELLVPATVTIQPGDLGASMPLFAVDDDFIDGTREVQVTATVTHWPTASATTFVHDNEPQVLSLTMPHRGKESSGTVVNGGTVKLSAQVESSLSVMLASDDPTELTVPAVVIVPARSSSVSFQVNFENDDLEDGAQTVNVSASAEGFVTANATVIVEDDEVPAMAVFPVPANDAVLVHPDTDLDWQYDPATGGAPFGYEIYFGTNPDPTAEDIIGSSVMSQRALPRLTPGQTYYWRIASKKGAATTMGPIWSFTVAPIGPPTRLGWQPLPPAVAAGADFTARISAYDAFDNEVTSFNGSAALQTSGGGPETTTGTGSLQWEFPMATHFHDARTQSIYLPSEIGPAGTLTSLALDVVTTPRLTMKDFTIRMKHTTRESYVAGATSENLWDTTGWTTVYSSTTTVSTTGWKWFVFTTPFQYDGTSNLMVDISFNNTSYLAPPGQCRATPASTYRSLAHILDGSTSTNIHPKDWLPNMPLGYSNMSLPNLRLRRSESVVPVTPAVVGPFVNGTWSGDIALGTAGEFVRIEATSMTEPVVSGVSTPLDVVEVPVPVLDEEPNFTGGTTNTLRWSLAGSADQYEVQASATQDFAEVKSSSPIAGSEHTFENLADGQLYHYRVRAIANGVPGPWSLPLRSTQDSQPPLLQYLPASGGIVLGDSLVLQGTGADETSGVAALTVDGVAAATENGFGNWQLNLENLQEGANSISVTVRDKAVPPNLHTENWTVTRISDILADEDRNGVGALLEFAFNATGTEGRSALPQVGPVADAGAEGSGLILSFRRRLAASALDYVIEISSDLIHWQPAAGAAEIVTVTPTGDGVTETVTARVRPQGGEKQTFVRVRVAVP